MGKQSHRVPGNQPDGLIEAVEHLVPPVERCAWGTVLVDEIIDKFEAKPLDDAEALARPRRDDVDHLMFRLRRRSPD